MLEKTLTIIENLGYFLTIAFAVLTTYCVSNVAFDWGIVTMAGMTLSIALITGCRIYEEFYGEDEDQEQE